MCGQHVHVSVSVQLCLLVGRCGRLRHAQRVATATAAAARTAAAGAGRGGRAQRPGHRIGEGSVSILLAMFLQHGRHEEALAAGEARVRKHLRVDGDLVVAQRARLIEPSAAVLAHVRLLARVREHVSLQMRLCLEAFACLHKGNVVN